MTKNFSVLLLFIFGSLGLSCAQDLDWVHNLGDVNVTVKRTAADGFGNVYISGHFKDSLDADPSPAVHMLYSQSTYQPTFIIKKDPDGNFLWGICTGGTGANGDVYSMLVDSIGNCIVSTNSNGNVDYDPGPGVLTLPQGAVLWKVSPNGNLVWAKGLVGTGTNIVNDIEMDQAGNLFCLGRFSNTIDFDPGPGTNIGVLGPNYTSNYILRLDNAGNLQRVIRFDGNYIAKEIELDSAGNVYTIGEFSGTVDFDPGPGTFPLVATGSLNGFLHKVDSTGNLIWAKNIGPRPRNFKLALGQFLYITGGFSGQIDVDPGPSTQYINSFGPENGFTSKFDLSGNFVWARVLESLSNSIGWRVATDSAGSVYTTGRFADIMDADPGIGQNQLYALGQFSNTNSAFLQKLDAAGNFIYAHAFQGNRGSDIENIEIDHFGNILLVGEFTFQTDFAHGPPAYQFPIPSFGDYRFSAKWNPYSCNNLAIRFDSLQSISCIDSAFVSGAAINGFPPYTYAWTFTPLLNVPFLHTDSAGIYTLTVVDSLNCSAENSVLIQAPSTFQGFDLNSFLIAQNTVRPGFPHQIQLNAFNDGCQPISGQIILHLNPYFIFNSASPAPDQIIGDSLIWNFSNWTYDSTHFQALINLTLSPLAPSSGQICNDLTILQIVGDADTTNNIKHYCANVMNSYDPNDKQVYPVGECNLGFVRPNELLTYTLRFQNTGTASAINVLLIDYLSSFLDITSVRVVAQSHPGLITEVLSGNRLRFRLDNIQLPDSVSDPQGSQGYVVFEASPLPSLANRTKIDNVVEIYFDFNAPVVTNTVSNTLMDTLPSLRPPTQITASACDSFAWNGQTYTASGIYQAIFSGANGCDSLVDLNLTIGQVSATFVLNGSTLVSTGTSGNFQWLDCGNNFAQIPGETQASFTPTQTGSYALVVIDGLCSDTSACATVTVVGNAQPWSEAITIFPNPHENSFVIDLGQLQNDVQISVSDIAGKKLYETHFDALEALPLHLNLAKGVYFVRVKVAEREVFLKVLRE